MTHIKSLRPFSSHFPLLYKIRVWQRRLQKHLSWLLTTRRFSRKRQLEKLPFSHFKHQSKLIKPLGDTQMQWQINKVTNLKLAIERLSGILIAPGEFFSFHKLVGKPTPQKGYLEGMELSLGQARAGIGGGLCQLSNLIHWMALHSPLKVIERSNHSFDPFPDEGRVLPFGSGAALFYNYIDLVLYNPTPITFQLNFFLTDRLVNGEIRAEKAPTLKYHIYEKNHKFT